jgi:hypothetical protein
MTGKEYMCMNKNSHPALLVKHDFLKEIEKARIKCDIEICELTVSHVLIPFFHAYSNRGSASSRSRSHG